MLDVNLAFVVVVQDSAVKTREALAVLVARVAERYLAAGKASVIGKRDEPVIVHVRTALRSTNAFIIRNRAIATAAVAIKIESGVALVAIFTATVTAAAPIIAIVTMSEVSTILVVSSWEWLTNFVGANATVLTLADGL